MAFCKDKSTTYLEARGYNVVRHPSALLKPLILLGRQNGTTIELGGLDKLTYQSGSALPAINRDTAAADLNGQVTNKLSISIGANILGAVIGAMGGQLGVDVSYTNAERIEFRFIEVTNDSALPIEIGNYLRDGEIDAGNAVLKEYVLGNGELFVVTKTAKSKRFEVRFERKNQTGATVKIPVLKGLVGGTIKVDASSDDAATVRFDGPRPLVFGFQCLRIAVLEGEVSLVSVKPGGVAAAAGGTSADDYVLLASNQLLDIAPPS